MKCKVCSKRIKLIAAKKYLVAKEKGPLDFLTAQSVYEAFDCPSCGCQNIVNIRENNIIESEG